MTKNRLALEVMGADQEEKSDLDKSRNYFALLAWKRGARKKIRRRFREKKRKNILKNPADASSHLDARLARAAPASLPRGALRAT